MKFIDNILNKISMYRLVLYVLGGFIVAALIFSTLGLLPFSPLALIYSTAVLIIVSFVTNRLFTTVFKTHANVESFWITALILALIISPPQAYEYLSILPFLIWAGIWSMAVKFILAISKKHIFNPAAFAVALTAITLGQAATWWIGTIYMLPLILIGGLLITKKIRRFDLVISFTVVALITIVLTSGLQSGLAGLPLILKRIFVDSPLVFFALIMLTEPLTTPPTRSRRLIYGIFVGLLFAPALHIGSLYSTPELALLAGNVLAFFLSPMRKYILTMKELRTIAKNTDEFIYTPDHAVKFVPGQYMEWTYGHGKPDSRGNRRYFTIASSPTEPEIHLGVKFYDPASSFKNAFGAMTTGDTIMAGGVAGDFTMPRDKTQKLVFIAGGIGITPFRSMVKYMIDTNETRDVILIYSNKTKEEIAYEDIWKEAGEKLGMKTIYTLTDIEDTPSDWSGERGLLNAEMVKRVVPDYADRVFYISGPHGMVTAFKEMLIGMGVSRRNVKTDYFPGFV